MAERTTLKLRDVRVAFAHFGKPDNFGKYSGVVLIPKGSKSEEKLYKALRDAWVCGTDAFGKAVFEQNPTKVRLEKAAYLQIGGGTDTKGKPLPEWKKDFICFSVNSTKPPVCVDGDLEPIDPEDGSLYDGAAINISLDIVPFNNAESHNSGFSKYLRSVVVLGGGERISTATGGFTDVISEWGDED